MKLEDIVEHYGTMVATIAHRMIQNREIAKEAAQEVWYEVFKSLPSFNADSELSTWIIRLRSGLFRGMLKMKRWRPW